MTLIGLNPLRRFQEVQFKEIKSKGQDEIGSHPMGVVVTLETGEDKKQPHGRRQEHG